MKEALSQVDDKQLDKIQAIIRGMTQAERDDPKIINARVASASPRARASPSPTSTSSSTASSPLAR